MSELKQKIIMLLMPVIIILISLFLAIVAGGEFCYFFAIVPTAVVFYILLFKPRSCDIYKKRLSALLVELFVVIISWYLNYIIASIIAFLIPVINLVYYFIKADDKKTPVILLLTDPYLCYAVYFMLRLVEINHKGFFYA